MTFLMRARIVIVILIMTRAVYAQNLVPNPGFETFYRCPFGYNAYAKDFYLPGWNSPSEGTPDYFHTCSRAGDSSVPRNWAGVADPHSGSGYAGVYVWGRNGKSYREYIQSKLVEPLQKGKTYSVGFYFKLSSYSQYKTDRIGLLLLDTALELRRNKVFPVEPTLSVIQTPMEAGGWDQANMMYKAHGGETYLVVGNFYDDHNTENIRLDHRTGKSSTLNGIAYFYIDDVSVMPVREDSIVSANAELHNPSNRIYALKNIQFEFNSYRLIPSYIPELDKLVAILKDKSQWNVELIGHTDDVGPDAYNVVLSRSRATGVSEYLKSRGIASARITTTAMGEAKPLINKTDENSRMVNRRVEVQFVER
jgi:OOP family OmpA-OmpF porin